MGTTIGINTMLLFASVFYILQQQKPLALKTKKSLIGRGITITNISLIFFWSALIGSGLVKISGKLDNKTFVQIMDACKPFFKIFTASGVFILVGLIIMILGAWLAMRRKERKTPIARDTNSTLELDTVV
jgi:nitric oxide reductase subunit B